MRLCFQLRLFLGKGAVFLLHAGNFRAKLLCARQMPSAAAFQRLDRLRVGLAVFLGRKQGELQLIFLPA